MEFLTWHYTKGLEFYVQSWLSTFDWMNHYFSFPLLLKTLFSPWKRLIVVDTSPGFNLQKKFEAFTFNLISRFIGAIVRFIMFWVGLIFIIFTFLGGIAGLFFWVLMPIFGLPVFSKYKSQPKQYLQRLMSDLQYANKNELETIFESEAGKFTLDHCGLDYGDLIENAVKDNADVSKIKAKSFKDIIDKLIKDNVWRNEYFNKREIKSEDLVLAASWWDKKRLHETKMDESNFGRPGIAMELTFGYTPTLNRYSVDLAVPQDFTHRLIGRQNAVERIERALTSGNNVVVMGQPGVGKKTVVLEFAHRAVTGQLGSKMAFKRILEFDYNSLLSEAIDLNQKKTKLMLIFAEAAAAGNTILVFRDIHRLTNPEVEGYDFNDVFEERLEKRDLKIIAITTNTEYERFIAPNLRLRKYFETVEVTPPSKEEAMEILIDSAQRWEKLKNLTILVPALRKIIDESDRYVSEIPFPEKAIELLDALVVYVEKKEKNIITTDDANSVLAEKTGISFAKLTEVEKQRLQDIENIIHERLIDQNIAVNLIGKTLRAKTVGVIKNERPVGSFLFLGPTGVGKTETAKVLAKVYYGSSDNILRFDMAEYSGAEGLERLIGSVSKNLPGSLSTAIKNRPASLLLLDEIEKASKDVSNLFLSLLDEGYFTDAFGKRINGRHLFIVGTSNAGAEFIRQQVNKGVVGEELQSTVVNYVLEKQIFSPEFLNRFDGVVVYEPLNNSDLVKIAKLMLIDLAENLKLKNIYIEFTDESAQKLAQDGYDPAFGARPMRRIVNISLGDLIGRAILKNEISQGDKIKLLPGKNKEEFTLEKID